MDNPKIAKSVTMLENFFDFYRGRGLAMEWRIVESRKYYGIVAESKIYGYMCIYHTPSWDEVVEFCRTHCNPGYDLMHGLGLTEVELACATEDYIHSLGKKTWAERASRR